MTDPTISINAPPPRYLLESDSEDEEGQGVYGAGGSGPSRPKIQLQHESVSIKWTDSASSYDRVILGVGQAGAWIRRKVGNGEGVLKVQRGDDVLGLGMQVDGTLLLDMKDVDNESAWEIATSLLQSIKAKEW